MAEVTTETQTHSSSALLELPLELRLLVYDSLFEPLVERSEILDSYALPGEWPKNDLSSYTSLVLSCRQVHDEAKSHCEAHYLSRLTMKFDNVPQLFLFSEKLSRLGSAYQDIHISLRIHCDLFYEQSLLEHMASVDDVDVNNSNFLSNQPGFESFHATWGEGFCYETDSEYNHRMMSGKAELSGAELRHSVRNGRTIDVVTKSVGPAGKALHMTVRQICGLETSAYTELHGIATSISWDWFVRDTVKENVRDLRRRGALEGRPSYNPACERLRKVLKLENRC